MNIIDVLIEECRSLMRIKTFEINSVLANPAESGSLDRFRNAIYDYTQHQSVCENLLKLKNQIDEANNTQEPVDEN